MSEEVDGSRIDSNTNTVEELQTNNPEITALTDYLTKTKREVAGWAIEKAIGNGANGVVLQVRRNDKEKAVMKVALNTSSSSSLVWEAAVMNHIQNPKWDEDRTRHVVRMLDYGTTANHIKEEVSYVVMEFLPGNPVNIISKQNTTEEAIDKVCEFGLHLLKGIYDLHCVGLLHRDLKPENVGLYKEKLLVLFDMGMARLFTNEEGKRRDLRGYVGMRGTDEWASLGCELGKDQSRVDDLWGWFYCLVEWTNCKSNKPLAWADYESEQDIRLLMKSHLFPAKLVLANCPSQFYNIQLYLRSLTHDITPDYFYIASLLKMAKREVKRVRPHPVNPKTFAAQQVILEKQF